MGSLQEGLASGLGKLGLELPSGRQDALVNYLLLLDKWNAAYNLSGIRDVDKMVPYHLLDSLAIVPYIDGAMILDVGTGAGLPGIPLAICYPDKQFLLLDSNGKKTRFLTQAKTELGLDNVIVIHDRIESFQSSEQIDIVLCRAFAALDKIVTLCSHLLGPSSKLLAMKGQLPEAEMAALPETVNVTNCINLPVPDVDGPRHLIEIVPAARK